MHVRFLWVFTVWMSNELFLSDDLLYLHFNESYSRFAGFASYLYCSFSIVSWSVWRSNLAPSSFDFFLHSDLKSWVHEGKSHDDIISRNPVLWYRLILFKHESDDLLLKNRSLNYIVRCVIDQTRLILINMSNY